MPRGRVTSPAYRQEPARLVIDTGRTIAEVARKIGVGEALRGRWVVKERARTDDPPIAVDVEERTELEPSKSLQVDGNLHGNGKSSLGR